MVVSGPAGPERRRVMDAGTHPSVEGIKQEVQSKGGTLSCPLCGREEFALEEVSVMSAGMGEGYGTRRVQRGQLVCENCGCVVAIDLARLGATGGGS
jgi:transcription elongation factor Elf1